MSKLEIVAITAALILCVLVPILLRRNRYRLSQDDAEIIVRRRYREGEIIGARFTNEYGSPAWEFDILSKGRIRRVQVGAKTGTIESERDLPARGSYGTKLGKKVLE